MLVGPVRFFAFRCVHACMPPQALWSRNFISVSPSRSISAKNIFISCQPSIFTNTDMSYSTTASRDNEKQTQSEEESETLLAAEVKN